MRSLLFGILITAALTLTLTLHGERLGYGSMIKAQAVNGVVQNQPWNETKDDSTLGVWSSIMELDTKSAEVKALYARVKASVNDDLFHIDSLATDQLSDIAAADFAWGDYDNDGDVDMLVAGLKETAGLAQGSFTQIYRNDHGALTPIHAGLTGITRGQVAWGDYDNDGDLDILLSGKASSGQLLTQIYQNRGSQFTDINADLVGLLDGRIAWGDYDNDGDLDLLIAGEDDHFYQRTLIYRNDSGLFVEQNGLLPIECKCNVAWGDYNNDEMLDILVSSIGPYEQIATVFQNTGGGFSNIRANLTPVKALGEAIWSDYDSDGDLDILITGIADNERPVTQLYRNDAGQYTEANSPLHPVWNSDSSWGDYDNDGDLDLLLTGDMLEQSPLTRLYRNDHSTFTEINIGLPNLYNGRIAWGDYDSDRDLDILYSGWDSDGRPFTQVWANRGGANDPPQAPQDLKSTTSANFVNFSWKPGVDLETPTAGLQYTLALHQVDMPNEAEFKGIETATDAVASLSTLLERWPKAITASGITRSGLSATLNLHPGSYAWAVQTIDSASEASVWSSPEPLKIIPDIVVSQAITPAIAQPGEPITVTMYFSNTGNYLATDVLLTSTLSAEIALQEIRIEPDLGVTISQTNRSVVAMVSWDTVPADEEPPLNTVRVWSSSDLGSGQGGQIIMIGRVAKTASTATYTQTLLGRASHEPIVANNVSTASLDVVILPKKSWFTYLLLTLQYQKLLASVGFGVICFFLVSASFFRMVQK